MKFCTSNMDLIVVVAKQKIHWIGAVIVIPSIERTYIFIIIYIHMLLTIKGSVIKLYTSIL